MQAIEIIDYCERLQKQHKKSQTQTKLNLFNSKVDLDAVNGS